MPEVWLLTHVLLISEWLRNSVIFPQARRPINISLTSPVYFRFITNFKNLQLFYINLRHPPNGKSSAPLQKRLNVHAAFLMKIKHNLFRFIIKLNTITLPLKTKHDSIVCLGSSLWEHLLKRVAENDVDFIAKVIIRIRKKRWNRDTQKASGGSMLFLLRRPDNLNRIMEKRYPLPQKYS